MSVPLRSYPSILVTSLHGQEQGLQGPGWSAHFWFSAQGKLSCRGGSWGKLWKMEKIWTAREVTMSKTSYLPSRTLSKPPWPPQTSAEEAPWDTSWDTQLECRAWGLDPCMAPRQAGHLIKNGHHYLIPNCLPSLGSSTLDLNVWICHFKDPRT